MRLLLATTPGPRARPGDYCFAVPGEPVTPLLPPCTAPGRCGCRRAFDGLESDRATTTATVADLPSIDAAGLLVMLERAAERNAAVPGRREVPSPAEQLDRIVKIVSCWPPGTILWRDDTDQCIEQRRSDEDAA